MGRQFRDRSHDHEVRRVAEQHPRHRDPRSPKRSAPRSRCVPQKRRNEFLQHEDRPGDPGALNARSRPVPAPAAISTRQSAQFRRKTRQPGSRPLPPSARSALPPSLRPGTDRQHAADELHDETRLGAGRQQLSASPPRHGECTAAAGMRRQSVHQGGGRKDTARRPGDDDEQARRPSGCARGNRSALQPRRRLQCQPEQRPDETEAPPMIGEAREHDQVIAPRGFDRVLELGWSSSARLGSVARACLRDAPPRQPGNRAGSRASLLAEAVTL